MATVDINDLRDLSNLNKLSEIFRDLNYEYVNDQLSTRHWNQQFAQYVVDSDIRLLARHKDFHIVFCRIEPLLLGTERPIVNQLLKEHPYILVIFSDEFQKNWHLVNIKYDEEVKNRRLFRRIVIGPDERLHTAAQRINKLEVADDKTSALELQQKHDLAFDVEEVTKQFFNTFVEMFNLLRQEIAQNNPTFKSQADEQAQLLLNRLMFLYFIQKKGWLNNNSNYLYDRFMSYYKNAPQGSTFYSDFLTKLFQVLSSQNLKFKDLGDVPFLNGGLFEVDPLQSKLPFSLRISNSVFKDIFENLLEHFNFTVREDTPLDVEVAIDPEMLGKVFENLILQSEKGRELRKMTGSYYTPRVIVHFMCQESLKEYLATESEIHKSKIELLFKMNPADQLTEEEYESLQNSFSIQEVRLLRNLIKKAYILDPAVGSGAFLVGMLHIMISIIKLLDVREFGKEHILRANYDYELKRELIETSLYGVDIQMQAVRICELRLWLSLIVDYEKVKSEEVPPLPNLSYRIRCGDSLIEKLFGHNVQLDQLDRTDKGRQLIDEIKNDKEAYFLARDIEEKKRIELSTLAKQCELLELLIKEKQRTMTAAQTSLLEETATERKIREEFEETKNEYERILLLAHNTRKKVEAMLDRKLAIPAEDIHELKNNLGISFISKLDFAEVFKDKEGFDIVIANPPYVFTRKMKFSNEFKYYIQRNYLCKLKSASHGRAQQSGKINLFSLFVMKGISLCSDKGIMTYIIPNTILRTTTYDVYRKYMLDNSRILQIVDLGGGIFDGVTAATILTTLQKECSPEARNSNRVKSIFNIADLEKERFRVNNIRQDSFYNNVSHAFNIFVDEVMSKLMVKISNNKQPLREFCLDIIEGIVAHKNLMAEPKTPNSFPLLEGKNIKKYSVTHPQKNIIWNKQKIHRPRPDYVWDSDEKIVIQRISGGCSPIVAAIDRKRYKTFASVNNLLLKKEYKQCYRYILALLNSKLLNYYYANNFSNKSELTVNISKTYLEELPIIEVSEAERRYFDNLVEEILAITRDGNYLQNPTKQAKVKELEHKIDQGIYRLYDLTTEEVALIGESIKQ